MEKNVVTKLEDLNLINRFLFDEVMEDRESYQATVSILLGEDIQLLDEPETEKELRVSPELREIRLDVVSMDKGGKLYGDAAEEHEELKAEEPVLPGAAGCIPVSAGEQGF